MQMLQTGNLHTILIFLTNEDHLEGILAIAKIQVPIKTNFMGKGINA